MTMTEPRGRERARQMVAENERGVTFRELGVRWGVSQQRVHQIVKAERARQGLPLVRERATTTKPQPRCVDCGAATTISHARCARCGQQRSAEASRARWRAHHERVERMWAEGKSQREIGAAMGWTQVGPHFAHLRALGVNLPHRPRPGSWSEPMIIEAIQAWAAEHGRAPLYKDWERAGPTWPASSAAAHRFGSWNAAIRAAGFEPRHHGFRRRPRPVRAGPRPSRPSQR